MTKDMEQKDAGRSGGDGDGGPVIIKEERRVFLDSSAEEFAAKVESDGVHQQIGNNRKSSSPDRKDLGSTKQQVTVATIQERSAMEPFSIASSSSSQKKQTTKEQEDHELESARAEMGEMRAENQRLRMRLDRIMKDYRTLQMQFSDLIQQDEAQKSAETIDNHQLGTEEPELVSLRLGRTSSDEPKTKDGKNKMTTCGQGSDGINGDQNEEGLSLGLKFEASKASPSPVNSVEEAKEEAGETWPPSKVLKTMRSTTAADDEVVQQNPVKKARVSVRARCDTPTMNDGCQWRKYGQKIAKGNPCPRAYYRCTVAPSCPVRKQVQRCVDDMSILVTTYEGTHNHPLPIAATAMASTTSAAASMLLSGSSSSSENGLGASATSSTTPANLDGLNFYLSNNTRANGFYYSSPLSSSLSNPTITLDLTASPSSSHPFVRFSSIHPSIAKLSSMSLNFSCSESSPMPASAWGNSFLTYGNAAQPYNRNQLGTLNLGRPSPIDNNNSLYQPSLQKTNPATPLQGPQHSLTLPDTIAAATKAITADPTFQSALVAALSSIMGSGSSGSGGTIAGVGDNSTAQKLKWGEQFPVTTTSTSTTPGGNACATSFLNKTVASTSTQSGNLMFLPTPLPFPSPRSASASPGESRDHTN